MLYESQIERYANAMLHGAKRKGYTSQEIAAALHIPDVGAIPGIEIVPLKPAALSAFEKRVEELAKDQRDEDLVENLEITGELFGVMQRNIKWLVKDDFYGLTESPVKPGTFLVMIEMLLPSNTLDAAVRRGIRFFEAVTDDIQFEFRRGEQFAEFSVTLAKPELDPFNFLTEWYLIIWHRLFSWLIGDKIPILNADFPHAAASPPEVYSQVFSSNCRFEQPQAVIRFNSQFLRKHCVRTYDDFLKFCETQNFDFVTMPGMDNPLAPRIEAQLEVHFAQTRDFLSMEEIADEYHISSQTLRRRLDDEGSSYRAIKEKIRRNAVMRLLKDPDIPISEIARMTGFAEANGLSRAVKAWIGESPTEFRTRLQKEGSSPQP